MLFARAARQGGNVAVRLEQCNIESRNVEGKLAHLLSLSSEINLFNKSIFAILTPKIQSTKY